MSTTSCATAQFCELLQFLHSLRGYVVFTFYKRADKVLLDLDRVLYSSSTCGIR